MLDVDDIEDVEIELDVDTLIMKKIVHYCYFDLDIRPQIQLKKGRALITENKRTTIFFEKQSGWNTTYFSCILAELHARVDSHS